MADSVGLLLSSRGPETLWNDRMRKFSHVGEYINALNKLQVGNIGMTLETAANLLQANANRIAVDPERCIQVMFGAGCLLGARVGIKFIPTDVYRRVYGMHFSPEAGAEPDIVARVSRYAREIEVYGEEGYQAAPSYHDLMDLWEAELTPAYPAESHLLKVGLGYMLRQFQETAERVSTNQ